MAGELGLINGLYESIITNSLKEQIENVNERRRVETKHLDSEESHFTLALHLTKLIANSLAKIKGDNRFEKQAEFCNKILDAIGKQDSTFDFENEKIIKDLKYLFEVCDTTERKFERPATPLSNACLFTGTRNDPSLESQLRQEILTSDRIDILCSFIKWSGIRLLKEELEAFTNKAGGRLRVITTSYLGATDYKAIEFLEQLPNTELLVSYDTKRTRLHAKSYIFHRNSGFGAAYIGSSNISNPALTSGLEWNLKVSQFELPYLWDKVCATFETYQNSKDFTPYFKDDKERLQSALNKESGYKDDQELMAFFNIKPYDYQVEILDKLTAERQIHNRYHNLIVAATGTGKTVIAAFDFKRIKSQKSNAKFLFIAHREEILKQSRATFRNILRDQNFGELLVGKYNAEHFEQLFVSIQSLNSRELIKHLAEDYYDYIVIDEFHHAASKSYKEILDYFKPRYLLGLTATPERHDGLEILHYFDNHIAAEIRLPDAINRKLLCPFQYFGITDHSSVDLSNISWNRGRYDPTQLDNILTGNDSRALLVIEKINELLLDANETRGLCFCVSQRHANFMAEKLNACGIKAASLTSKSTNEQRSSVQNMLKNKEINFICVVDLYNEGVDIPEIDTVLFLRPTESLTVFLQQLGRGLRLDDWKECLTVLDFVGNANSSFNFEGRFRSILGPSTKNIFDEVEAGFPHLPAGCCIMLEKQAQQYILNNVKSNIHNARKNQLISGIRNFTSETGLKLSLTSFINHHDLSLDTIYRKSSWNRLLVNAGLKGDFQCHNESQLTKGLRRICHMNSTYQLQRLLDLLTSPTLDDITENDKLLLTMLNFSLWGKKNEFSSLEEAMIQIRKNEILYAELLELIGYMFEETNLVTSRTELPFETPLELHANYTRDEILVALGNWNFENSPEMREGVKYIKNINTDVFLITLNKSEKHYSPTTMYLDYAISKDLFHWQSQSQTSIGSPTGQRYINHQQYGTTILLFLREDKSVNGLSSPYCFLGEAKYISHEGSKPISFKWKLKTPMPSHLYRETARLATA
ncbi:DUF3427 domain-containing protein [Lentisphaerota bacterium ZTH]|nr:DUF3427 domain-containing protein [Lentisphaerota bacterium]WET05701.1 DUF3427 domain-containing protein [Lentisphaerota bacterium ZTH]